MKQEQRIYRNSDT